MKLHKRSLLSKLGVATGAALFLLFPCVTIGQVSGGTISGTANQRPTHKTRMLATGRAELYS